MKQMVKRSLVMALFWLIAPSLQAQETSNGTLKLVKESWQAWSADSGEWVSPEEFWTRYAEQNGGLTWGTRTDYPPYAEVDELDKMIIVLDSGPCLMEFFHQRWRRAQDVRRWDPQFNELLGCPNVFD